MHNDFLPLSPSPHKIAYWGSLYNRPENDQFLNDFVVDRYAELKKEHELSKAKIAELERKLSELQASLSSTPDPIPTASK